MEKNRRKPFENFIILGEIQFPIIKKTLLIVGFAAFFSMAVITGVYYYQSQSGFLYFMSNDLDAPLTRKSLLEVALPGFLLAEGLLLLLGFLFALYGSREAAVPVFKLENWAKQMGEGNLNALISFREKKRYRQLISLCNEASQKMKVAFLELDKLASKPPLGKGASEMDALEKRLEEIRKILEQFKF